MLKKEKEKIANTAQLKMVDIQPSLFHSFQIGMLSMRGQRVRHPLIHLTSQEQATCSCQIDKMKD